ncbi:MAG: hypothetical protein WA510_12730 [Acidobacteriaceae bacterium]
MRICCDARRKRAAIFVFFVLGLSRLPAQDAQRANQLVKQMEEVEGAARGERQHFMYRSKERSIRTGGHLWDELVVETSDGRIRRLLAIDGKPLSGAALTSEGNRLTNIVNHPDEYRREGQGLREDENRLANLLKQVPKLYVFRMDGSDGDCAGVAFDPNPQFQEQTFQDRILHAMSGVLFIHDDNNRLCRIDAHVNHTVEFGFGLLGKVNAQSHFSVRRQMIIPGQWKNTRILVHVDGRILLLKSVARDEDATHYDFKPIPQDLTTAQAAALVRSTNPEYEADRSSSH